MGTYKTFKVIKSELCKAQSQDRSENNSGRSVLQRGAPAQNAAFSVAGPFSTEKSLVAEFASVCKPFHVLILYNR